MTVDELLDRIDTLLDLKILNRLKEMETRIMSSLADAVAADQALGDEITQVLALVQEDTATIAQLQGAIGSGNLPPDQQADVDALVAKINAQHDQIAAALNPPATPPVEAPPADGTPLDSPAPIDGTPA